ncbi:MAG: hypothetical protein K2X81_18540 [Candidatus Obscuribacterales bacterium]|nr:hypothetical protein [Candidatus Obscuribacterales bacterium]
MDPGPSVKALSEITDAGMFERLATAILRASEPNYEPLAHLGVNIDGTTVKAPLDGICFVLESVPPRLIVAQHTICDLSDLEYKWLHDPSTVKARKGKPTAPAGDLLKTAEKVEEERTRTPLLKATLILTTNQEPSQDLIRAVNAQGQSRGIDIDIWMRSRLANFLDNTATGQWLRYKYLGIEQELLSTDLLQSLSKRSLEVNSLPDDPQAWIACGMDQALDGAVRDVTFLIAGSGFGKSVACRKWLMRHIDAGGAGLVIPHEVVLSSLTLEQAIENTLRQLHPRLAPINQDLASCCKPENPLRLVVEDINRSGQTQLLAERISRWTRKSDEKTAAESTWWRLICPIWAESLSSLADQIRKQVDPLIIFAESFAPIEGRRAVQRRAELRGTLLTDVEAEAISNSLGDDPLLIALYDQDSPVDAHKVLEQFVQRSLQRMSAVHHDCTAADYQKVLRLLATEMLANKQLEPRWAEVCEWFGRKGQPVQLLSHLVHASEVVHISGTPQEQRIEFRHDRVREWLLVDAASALVRESQLSDDIIAEPFFAEAIGLVLLQEGISEQFLNRVRLSNPLALFYALKQFGEPQNDQQHRIVKGIDSWLNDPIAVDPANQYLRWEASRMLSETQSKAAAIFATRLKGSFLTLFAARLRNGDIFGGIGLCANLHPGLTDPWRDRHIAHAKARFGKQLAQQLASMLEGSQLDKQLRIGALRFAGHLGDPLLAPSLEACWQQDSDRNEHLEDYLWAAAQCCGNDPPRYLAPICDAWAALSDVEVHGISPRQHLAANEVRFAFNRWIPIHALPYLIERAKQEEALRSPITWLLHAIDHPVALDFMVEEFAELRRIMEGTDSFSPFLSIVEQHWRRAQDDGHSMLPSSREHLLKIWQNASNDKFVRIQAFEFWAATRQGNDLEILQSIDSAFFGDRVLRQRLRRGDETAITALVEKLKSNDHWLYETRHVWSSELADVLDWLLQQRKQQATQWGQALEIDWITSERLIELPVEVSEPLLLKHWDNLRLGRHFVQAALYFATPALLDAVRTAVSECPEPRQLFEHLHSNMGIRVQGRKGLTSSKQLLALVPYLDLLDPFIEIHILWEECNRHGWFDFRRAYLDARLIKSSQLWDSSRAFQALDEMVAPNRLVWLDRWIDDFLKADTSWEEIAESIKSWLDTRKSFDALCLLADALIHAGNRGNLPMLKLYDGMPDEAKSVIVNTEFAVRRRTLH